MIYGQPGPVPLPGAAARAPCRGRRWREGQRASKLLPSGDTASVSAAFPPKGPFWLLPLPPGSARGIPCLAAGAGLPALTLLPQRGCTLAVPPPLPSLPQFPHRQVSATSQDPARLKGGSCAAAGAAVPSGRGCGGSGWHGASAPGSPQPPAAGAVPAARGDGFPSFLTFLLASAQKRALSACY